MRILVSFPPLLLLMKNIFFFYPGFLSGKNDSEGSKRRDSTTFIHLYQSRSLANIQIFLYSFTSDLAHITRLLIYEIYMPLKTGMWLIFNYIVLEILC